MLDQVLNGIALGAGFALGSAAMTVLRRFFIWVWKQDDR